MAAAYVFHGSYLFCLIWNPLLLLCAAESGLPGPELADSGVRSAGGRGPRRLGGRADGRGGCTPSCLDCRMLCSCRQQGAALPGPCLADTVSMLREGARRGVCLDASSQTR